ncbi:aldehyde dehydrogenase family protein, partial [Mesorhizobium sp.]
MFAALRRNPVLPLCLPMIRRLKSPHLFGAIDRLPALGRPVGNKTFEVVNPSTGEVLAELPDMGVEETRAAVDKAYVAQSGWAALTARERSDVLWRWHQLIIDHAGDLAA